LWLEGDVTGKVVGVVTSLPLIRMGTVYGAILGYSIIDL
jgi:hypothetical protein